MKITIKRGSLVLGALALLSSVLFVLPTTAAAYENCDENALCLYDQDGGKGTLEKPIARTLLSIPLSVNRGNSTARSVHNNTASWLCLYADAYYGGTLEAVAPRAEANLPGLPSELQGRVSSYKLVPSKGHCFTGFERCEPGKLCIFAEERARGGMYATTSSHNGYAPVWEDRVRSVVNNTSLYACFYPADLHTGGWRDANGTSYGAYKVVPGDSTTLPEPFAKSFRSHKLTDKADCS
ncbi:MULTISPECIES: peptidase inhibitor family I36 protein [Streptomyces]|uniref:peptidase inhibitor family I36 protein n=1 Tax=Streptomyces TaxID=1883 RepID=UPI00115FA5F4|nr:peptidase inhibitor family I36 protein [Streptomyces sp. CC53]